MTWREGHFVCEAAWETKRLVSMDIMEGKYQ
jgi:arginase family enzyme